MSVDLHSFELPPIGTQCYLVSNPQRKEFAVFDAPLEAWATVERFAAGTGFRLAGLYFTHGHWDHTLDGWRFNEANVPCFAHAGDRIMYEMPAIMASYSIPGLEMQPIRIGTWLKDGLQLEVVGRPVEVRHVPGHSLGSALFWFREDGIAITGDAVFNGSIGRTDFPGCSFEQLEDSILSQVYTLPDETILYPGHGPETTVGQEAVHNPFVQRR